MQDNKKNNYLARAILLSCIFFCYKSIAQQNDYVFRHLTTENGLINNLVYCLCQDSKGYIWIGTIDGLQRYDGTRFVDYLPDMHDPEALHNGKINSIFEDSKKRLWIGTDIGAPYQLDRNTGKFYNYSLHLSNGNAFINGAGKFIEDSNGGIWVMNKYGYYKLNSKTNQFEDVSSLAGISTEVRVENFDKDNKGNIWFVTNAGISCYNINTKKVFDKNDNPAHLKILDIKQHLTAFLISGNNFWMGVLDRTILLKYDINKNTISEFSLENSNLKNSFTAKFAVKTYNLTGAADNSVMVDLLAHGIAFYDPLKDSFTEVPLNNNDPNGLHGPVTTEWSTTTLKDRDGNMWVSGGDRGLNIFNPGKRRFTFYKSNILQDGGGQAYSANGFIQDSANADIYVGYYYTTGGIVKFDSNLVVKNKYLFSKAGNSNLLQNQVWCLYRNDDGTIWAPNQAKTILKLDTRNEKLSILIDTALYGIINTIERDAKGDTWLGCWSQGLKKIDHQTKQVKTFLSTVPGSFDTAKNILSLYLDGDSMVWVGTNNQGFLQFDKRTGKYAHQYLFDENNPYSISGNNIYKIIKYNADTLLLATNMGINIFNKKKKTFSNISIKDGLPGNVVTIIVLDDKQNLWAGCHGGLCKINMHTLAVTKYGMADGITDNTFNNAALKLKDGRYLISTERGFIAFDPNELTDALPAWPIITGFRVFDKAVKIDSLLDLGAPVVLSYKDNSIVIEFAVPQYNFSDELKYYYQLKSVDKDWVLADRSQAAHYNQLQSGKYIFKVKVVNRDGVESQISLPLSIYITSPFWQTWWFRTMALLVLVFLAWSFYRFRIKTLQTIQEEKLKVEKLNAEKYKSRLEIEQVINYFSNSLVNKHRVDDVLWDVAKNLIGKLGFADCIIYLWNEGKTKMIQKAGYGPKGSLDEIKKQPFDVEEGQGVVGYVMKHKEPVIIPDTSVDERYRPDEMVRLSEITVPIVYNDELVGIIDSEHPERNFFTEKHLQLLLTIAALMETKMHDIQAQQSLQMAQKEKAEMQYENLKQHLNPHFLFNSLAAVIGLIKNDPKLAVEFVKNLNRVYRYILQNKDEQLVTLQAELDFAQQYFQLQKIRFGNGIEIHINIDENALWKKIVPVALQNLIENAIKHNVIDDENPLLVEIFTEAGYLIVRNNLQKKSFVETSNQQGLKNMSLLYNYLSHEPLKIESDTSYFTVKIPLL